MSEKPLLLHSAKTGVLIGLPREGAPQTKNRPLGGFWPIPLLERYYWLRPLALMAGVCVVLFGAFDAASRMAPAVSREAGVAAFAPAIVALDSAAREAVAASATSTPSIAPATLATTTRQATSTPFTPARLVISSLGVDARVERVGVRPDGRMANPSSFRTVGWYQLGAKPGEEGNAVLAGHVNNGIGLAGVFSRLTEIPIGAEVVVQGEGRELRYRVVQKTRYDADNAPLKEIFSIEGPSRLVLITCEGDWDKESRSYDKRLVVVAELVF